MRSRIFEKVTLLVLIAIVLAVLMEYFMFTGNAGEVIRQYMELDSAGNVQSSKAAFRNYTYQVTEQAETMMGKVDNHPSVIGQALADAAYGEYLTYQREKEKHKGKNFGSWIYTKWFDIIPKLDADRKTYDDEFEREESTSDGRAWCAIFYSCMAQAVQRGQGGALLYGSLCEKLYGQYCVTDAYVVATKSSYLIEHLESAGKGVDDFYGYVAKYCEDISVARNKIAFVEQDSFMPQPGDLVFFHWSSDTVSVDKWITHIGIVYSYDMETGSVTVIEGNRNGNHIATKSEVACTVYQDDAELRALDKKNFVGYVRPAY